MNRFEEAIKFVLKLEGGFVNDIHDKGGMTYKGICRKYYPKLKIWNKIDKLLKEDFTSKEINEALKNEDMTEIYDVYRKDYWDKCDCDNRQTPIDIIVFDTAVNMGVSRANEFLKITKRPIAYLQQRINYYKLIVEKNPTQSKFLKGWINRVRNLCDFCSIPKEYLDF